MQLLINHLIKHLWELEVSRFALHIQGWGLTSHLCAEFSLWLGGFLWVSRWSGISKFSVVCDYAP